MHLVFSELNESTSYFKDDGAWKLGCASSNPHKMWAISVENTTHRPWWIHTYIRQQNHTLMDDLDLQRGVISLTNCPAFLWCTQGTTERSSGLFTGHMFNPGSYVCKGQGLSHLITVILRNLNLDRFSPPRAGLQRILSEITSPNCLE